MLLKCILFLIDRNLIFPRDMSQLLTFSLSFRHHSLHWNRSNILFCPGLWFWKCGHLNFDSIILSSCMMTYTNLLNNCFISFCGIPHPDTYDCFPSCVMTHLDLQYDCVLHLQYDCVLHLQYDFVLHFLYDATSPPTRPPMSSYTATVPVSNHKKKKQHFPETRCVFIQDL